MKTTGVFDCELGSGGVYIISTRSWVTNGALSDEEIDQEVKDAKADLDAVAKRAKKMLKKVKSQPLFAK